MMPDRLIVNVTTELTLEELRELLRRGNPDDEYIGQAVATARRVLEAAGYDLARAHLGNLMAETLDGDEEQHCALKVIYYAEQMARAMAENRIVDVRWNALRFERAHVLAATMETWGPAFRQARSAGKRKRDKTKAVPATVVARYNELIAAGVAPKTAKLDVMREFGIGRTTLNSYFGRKG